MTSIGSEAALLLPAEMDLADQLTIKSGVSGITLMRAAGNAVARHVMDAYPRAKRIALLCGPGNNGGDAFVAASRLAEAGIAVSLFSTTSPQAYRGDAAIAGAPFADQLQPIAAFEPSAVDLVIDALFGAGLARPVEGDAAAAIAKANAGPAPIVAIDLPSGISGATGQCLGVAIEAELTVTFFRRKPGHLLLPGRSHCGHVVVAEIGIAASAVETIAPLCFANGPALWGDRLRWPVASGHKYDRGHAVVFSGGATKTGAARLSATAALRSGAGLVTILAPASSLLVNAAHLTAVMLARCDGNEELRGRLQDTRLTAFVLGPGFGDLERARAYALAILNAGRDLVLDADGISAFKETPDALFSAIVASAGDAVLTPHGGEFARLFPDIAANGGLAKTDKARAAAARSGAVVILKGADTVIADPDGRCAINDTGTPWLATAGSGDVLAGIVAGLLASKTPTFEAAACAVWLHGKAAEAFGPGLIAEDLADMLPQALRGLLI